MKKTDYISTRGQAPVLGFEDVILTGLAQDGGLYVPRFLPRLTKNELAGFADMTYQQVACTVLPLFMDMPIERIKTLVQSSYAGFHHEEIAPFARLDEQQWVMEQFHGPTMAFKDFALQFLGHVFDAVLEDKHRHVTIVGATSGDTGSAAIAGCRGRESMDIFILHPYNRVSEVQRRQMTTITDKNVHNIAIEGSFDDCQQLIKDMFGDASFRQDIQMTAVNSINWGRILAQIVYYVYASTRSCMGNQPASFVVPTGNFGNIYAGYLAKSIGAPINRLIAATNRNDILYRFFNTGALEKNTVVPSLSPSMDIQVSSNLERLMFEAFHRDSARVRSFMADFQNSGKVTVPKNIQNSLAETFAAMRCDDKQTLDVIKDTYKKYNYLLDPHSATGVHAMQAYMEAEDYKGEDVITLATAHPAKFPEAVGKATGHSPNLPVFMDGLFEKQERYDILPNDLDKVKTYILQRV